MKKVTVVYESNKGVDAEFDTILEKVMKSYGLARGSSGCDLVTGERDIEFIETKRKK